MVYKTPLEKQQFGRIILLMHYKSCNCIISPIDGGIRGGCYAFLSEPRFTGLKDVQDELCLN